jgi:hypothetical protein
VLHNKMVYIHDIRYVILSTLFPLFMSNQSCRSPSTVHWAALGSVGERVL